MLGGLNAISDQPVQPIHVEEPGRPCLNGRNRRRRTAGTMVLASRDDLVLVDRDMPTQPFLRRANYAFNIVTVPFRTMSAFRVVEAEPSAPPRFCTLQLRCDRHVISYPCVDHPDRIAAVLAGHGVPRE